jgi:hypothetical protein
VVLVLHRNRNGRAPLSITASFSCVAPSIWLFTIVSWRDLL